MDDAPRPYLIDRILPAYEVHIIAAPSSTGKSTLSHQWLRAFSIGDPVLGYETHPCQLIYISADRSLATVKETMTRAGGLIPNMPVLSMVDNSWKWPRSISGITQACNATLKTKREVLLFIDGLQSLTPGGRINDYDTVLNFLVTLARWCQANHFTILGSGHATKSREGERITNPRQMILGSVAWGGFCTTVFILEPIFEKQQATDQCKLYMSTPNAPRIGATYQFDPKGCLVEPEQDVADAALGFQLDKLTAGTVMPRKVACEWGRAAGLSEVKVDCWLRAMVKAGILSNEGRGMYKKTFAV